MNFILLALATVAVVSAAPLTEGEYSYLFNQFNFDHGKVYAEEGMMARKYAVFKDNVDFINDHNANHAKTLGYTVGINQFADLTLNEFRKQYLGLNALAKPKFETVHLDETNTASSVDWTTKGAVTPVKNQAQCGSCWAFSTTGSLEGASFIKTGKLQSFSEQELVDCAGAYGNQGCNGGLMDDAFKFVEAKGIDLESTYAYTQTTGTCNTAKEAKADGLAPGAVASFKDVTPNSESQLAAAVTLGPVSVAIEADQSGFQFYTSGIFSGTCGTSLDHGVLAVGFGTDGGKNYWKVKNSWGSTWGNAGYIQLAKDISSTSGQCGIAMAASYPVMA